MKGHFISYLIILTARFRAELPSLQVARLEPQRQQDKNWLCTRED